MTTELSSRLDLPDYLSRLPLFQEMTAAELTRLAQGCRLRRFAKAEAVFRLGEPCEELHVVVSGQVKLFALSSAGQEKVIELIAPGQSFAEALMFTDKPYIVNAQTLADSLVLSVSKAAVLAEIARDSRFALRMLAGISRRLHGLIHDVQAYALHSGLQRVIGYLLRDLPESSLDAAAMTLAAHRPAGPEAVDAAQPQACQIRLPVSKATLASRLSLTPEYFSRVLRELEDQGLIRVEGREICIPDAARLARYPVN